MAPGLAAIWCLCLDRAAASVTGVTQCVLPVVPTSSSSSSSSFLMKSWGRVAWVLSLVQVLQLRRAGRREPWLLALLWASLEQRSRPLMVMLLMALVLLVAVVMQQGRLLL